MTDRTPDEDEALKAEETEFSNDHPLASPNELAGDAMSGLELEFAARDAVADAEGAASGAMLDVEGEDEESRDTLPLDGN